MPTRVCPTCKRLLRFAHRSELPYYPFCSKRCQQADLAKWLSGQYRISTPIPPDGCEPAEPADPPQG